MESAASPSLWPTLDPEIKKNCETLAKYVGKNGASFEKMAIARNQGNPLFAFLQGGLGVDYYKHCLAKYGTQAADASPASGSQAGKNNSKSGSNSAAASTAQLLASLNPEKALEAFKKALQQAPLAEKMSFNVDLALQLKDKDGDNNNNNNNNNSKSKVDGGANDEGLRSSGANDPRLVASDPRKANDPRLSKDPRLGSGAVDPRVAGSSGAGMPPSPSPPMPHPYPQHTYPYQGVGATSTDPRLHQSVDPRLQANTNTTTTRSFSIPQAQRTVDGGVSSTSNSTSTSTSSHELKLKLTEVIKHYLREPWKENRLSRESFKTICKKSVEDVLSDSFPNKRGFPTHKDDIKRFLSGDTKRKQIKNIVANYVEKYAK